MAAKTLLCAAALVLAIGCKFWFIAGMEVTDEPDDPPNYVAQILHGGPSFFGPGTGLFGKALRVVHVPFRTGIEAAWLGACVLAVGALFGSPARSPLALVLFLIISFHPAAEELFSHLLSDPLALVTLQGGIAAFVLFVATSSPWQWPCLLLAGAALGLAAITRPIFLPLLTSLTLWSLLLLLLQRGRRPGPPLAAGLFGGIVLAAAIYFTTCTENENHYGYDGISLPASREFGDLYMALQSVGDPTGDPYYPVDTARLQLAAQAGPQSKLFVDRMLTDQNFRRVSQEAYGRYDFALAWFYFPVFFNAVPDGRLDDGFALFKDVEREIARAGSEHRVPVRAILPLPDARLRIVLSVLPHAVVHVGALTTAIPHLYAWDGIKDGPRFDDPTFTDALSRRTVAPTPMRNAMGTALCAVYAFAARLMLPALVIALLACLVQAIRVRRFHMSERFLARQLFLLAWMAFFAWYTLFDASGFRAVERYLVFQNVLLPLLVTYYARVAWRLKAVV